MNIVKKVISISAILLTCLHYYTNIWNDITYEESDIDNYQDYNTVDDEVIAYYKSIDKPIPTHVVNIITGEIKEIKFEDLYLWRKD